MANSPVRKPRSEKGRASIFISLETAATLREIAAHLGYRIPSGPGTGILGSNKALLEAIAHAYETASQEERNEFLSRLKIALQTPWQP